MAEDIITKPKVITHTQNKTIWIIMQLDRNLFRYPEDASVYTGHSLLNITKHITLFKTTVNRSKFIDPGCNLDIDPNNLAP